MYHLRRRFNQPKPYALDVPNHNFTRLPEKNTETPPKLEMPQSLWNDDTYKEYMTIMSILSQPITDNSTIYYVINPGAGFANVARAIRGLISFCVLYNRPLRICWDGYFDNMGSCLQPLRIRRDEIPNLPMLSDKEFMAYAKGVTRGNYTHHGSFVTNTHNDVISKVYTSRERILLHKAGIMRRGEDMFRMRKRLTRFMFCPNEKLTNEIKRIVQSVGKRRLIGFQIRTGGTVANSNEKKAFIVEEKLPQIALNIKKLINPSVVVYLSTDSNFVVDYMKKFTGNQIMYMDSFTRGHSAPSKNSKTTNESMEGAICDLGVLSFSSIVYYTQYSSYGQFAYYLSRAPSRVLSR